VLEPALRVRVVLRTDGELPAPPYVFDCELKQGEVSVGEPQGMHWFTDVNREIAFLVSEPGPVRVLWHLERRLEGPGFGGAIGGDVLQEHEVEIEVQDVPREQVFTVDLDGAALTELAHDPPWKR